MQGVREDAGVGLSQKRIVLRHINALTSAMRTSPRWAQSSNASNAILSSATTSTSALSLTRAAHLLAQSELYSKEKEDDDADDNTRTEPASVGLLGGFTVLRAQLRMVSGTYREYMDRGEHSERVLALALVSMAFVPSHDRMTNASTNQSQIYRRFHYRPCSRTLWELFLVLGQLVLSHRQPWRL